MKTVFIDGSAGTTGLRIFERLGKRDDIKLITLAEGDRKDAEKRRCALNSCDIAFLCLPDAAAAEAVAMTENPDVTIIDTSTAHRTAAGWTYGFPELSDKHRRDIAFSKRIAVPGCHASGFIALVYPLAEAGLLRNDALLSCFSLTGYSGGGKKMIADYTSPDRDERYCAPAQYGLTQQHKHLAEMKAITNLSSSPIFCPIVADYYSGMQVTIPLFGSMIKAGIAEIKNIYRNKYNGKIVSFSDEIDSGNFAYSNALSGKDTMSVSVAGNDKRITLIAGYDNLGKGASGAAVQCMNIKLGIDETIGLEL